MIMKTEALELIKGSLKHEHSIQVSKVMKILARNLGCDENLWELVGILHDLDYDETSKDRSKHGIVAASRLEGMLPAEGIEAIMRHDYLTGLTPNTKLDHSLIFADALSIIIEDGHLGADVTEDALLNEIDRVSENKPWLKGIIEGFPFREEVDILEILNSVL